VGSCLERFAEASRWFAQALRDLKASIDSFNLGYYEWSCFQAQQAAEKAVKALLYAHGRSSWGHSVLELLEELKGLEEVGEDLRVNARELDRHYIPSRYPNAFESGYPGMYYDRVTAERAINASNTIIKWVRERLENLGLKL
jgi:Uncharacterized conserved protein related to C-terminal domain of eukaryotic chaperone, SACSIN